MKFETEPRESWDKLNSAFEYFMDYIATKNSSERFALTATDLVFVSNFKGGNASIVEPLDDLKRKIVKYSDKLSAVADLIGHRPLGQFNTLSELQRLSSDFIKLSLQADSKIAGLGPAYASAILAGYFPQTLPVIDRHVLRGSGIAHDVRRKQVVDIEKHYPSLLQRFRDEIVRRPQLSVRTLDKEWFNKGRKLNKTDPI